MNDITNNNNNNNNNDFDEDWEEWDGNSPFWHHCVAGSVAGFAEHTLIYPLDTVRTHMQVCSSCPNVNNASSGTTNNALNGSKGFIGNMISNTITNNNINNNSVQRRNRMMKPGTAPSSSSSTTTTAFIRNLSSSWVHPNPTSATATATTTTSTASSLVRSSKAVSSTSPTGLLQTIQYLVNEQAAVAAKSTTTTTVTTATKSGAGGLVRLFRGIQTMVVGCIPAHAVYFSSYEATKSTLKNHWYGDMIAGGIASIGHDVIMTPLDTIKQRMQLGHYNGIGQAYKQMIQNEGGYISLYRSFPITLITNVPYGMIMVGVNEYLKEQWCADGETKLSLQTTLAASSIAGFVASGCTTPLDRIKTSLQTQTLQPACRTTTTAAGTVLKGIDCPLTTNNNNGNSSIVIRNWHEAMTKILKEEGGVGLFRGIIPRVLSHTPAIAISWTSYETAKQLLSNNFS